MLRGKFIAIQAYLKKQVKSQINNLTLHLKQLEKEEMKNPGVSRRKEILKIRAEIDAKETKETIAKINKTKSWFFDVFKSQVNKIQRTESRSLLPGSKAGERTHQQRSRWKLFGVMEIFSILIVVHGHMSACLAQNS